MVKIINKAVCRGAAGKRLGKVKGIVIHNTWDDQKAEWHLNRLAKMSDKQLEAGFAHYYIDENTIVRVENTYNGAWHVANYDGNMNYIGFEVRGDRSTNKQAFLQAEQNAFWQAAADLKFYGLKPNRNTVMLHNEFSATECPKRSLMEHCGYDSSYAVPISVRNKLKDYFIKEILKYYNNPKLQPDVKTTENTKPTYHDKKGKFIALKDISIYNDKLRKNKSQLLMAKKSVFIIDEIVPIKNSVPVGRLRNGGYITLRKDFLKRK